MFRHAVKKLAPVGSVVANQVQRNFGVSAVAAQKGTLDPIQQLFIDKIREYRSKSVAGKLVDASPETEATLKDTLANLERAYGAKGVDMTQFPTFNFTEPTLVWPGLSPEQKQKIKEALELAAEATENAAREAEEEDKFDTLEGFK